MSRNAIGSPSATFRHDGPYAFVGGLWRPSRNQPTTPEISTIRLHGETSDDPIVEVPVSDVDRMVYVEPWCLYRGVRFSFMRVLDAAGRLVWRDAHVDEPGLEARLIYQLNWPEWRRVSKWKGFVYHDPRELGLVEGLVPFSEIEDYGEVVTAISIPGREGASA